MNALSFQLTIETHQLSEVSARSERICYPEFSANEDTIIVLQLMSDIPFMEYRNMFSTKSKIQTARFFGTNSSNIMQIPHPPKCFTQRDGPYIKSTPPVDSSRNFDLARGRVYAIGLEISLTAIKSQDFLRCLNDINLRICYTTALVFLVESFNRSRSQWS